MAEGRLPALEDRDGIPGASWIERLVTLVSSGFDGWRDHASKNKWERV